MKVFLLIKYILFCSLFMLLRKGRDPRFQTHGGSFREESNWSPPMSGDAQCVLIYAYEIYPHDVSVTMGSDHCDDNITHADVTPIGHVCILRGEHRTGCRTPSGVRANQLPGSFSCREYMPMSHNVYLMYILYRHTLLTLNELRVHVTYNFDIKTVLWLNTTGFVYYHIVSRPLAYLNIPNGECVNQSLYNYSRRINPYMTNVYFHISMRPEYYVYLITCIFMLTFCSICNGPRVYLVECQDDKYIVLVLLSFHMCVHFCMINANLDILQSDTGPETCRYHYDRWSSDDAAWGVFIPAWCLCPIVDTDFFALPSRPGAVSALLPIYCRVSYSGVYRRFEEYLPHLAYKTVHMCFISPLYGHIQHHLELSLVSRYANSVCGVRPHRAMQYSCDYTLVSLDRALYACQTQITMLQSYLMVYRWFDILCFIALFILATTFRWCIVYILLLHCVPYGINIPIDVYVHHGYNFYSFCLKIGPCFCSWLSEVLVFPDGAFHMERNVRSDSHDPYVLRHRSQYDASDISRPCRPVYSNLMIDISYVISSINICYSFRRCGDHRLHMYAFLYDCMFTFATISMIRFLTAYIMLDSVKYSLFTYNFLTFDFELHQMNSMNSSHDLCYLLCYGFRHDRGNFLLIVYCLFINAILLCSDLSFLTVPCECLYVYIFGYSLDMLWIIISPSGLEVDIHLYLYDYSLWRTDSTVSCHVISETVSDPGLYNFSYWLNAAHTMETSGHPRHSNTERYTHRALQSQPIPNTFTGELSSFVLSTKLCCYMEMDLVCTNLCLSQTNIASRNEGLLYMDSFFACLLLCILLLRRGIGRLCLNMSKFFHIEFSRLDRFMCTYYLKINVKYVSVFIVFTFMSYSYLKQNERVSIVMHF